MPCLWFCLTLHALVELFSYSDGLNLYPHPLSYLLPCKGTKLVSVSFPAILDPHFQLHPESSPEKVLLMQYVCSTIHFPPQQTSSTPSILSWLLVSPSSVPSGLDICSQSLNSVSFSFPPLPSLLSWGPSSPLWEDRGSPAGFPAPQSLRVPVHLPPAAELVL